MQGYGLAALLWRSLCYFQFNPSHTIVKDANNRAQTVGNCVRFPNSFMSSSHLVVKLHSFLKPPPLIVDVIDAFVTVRSTFIVPAFLYQVLIKE